MLITMLKEANKSALLTFIGCALIKFATGIIGIWGTINIYFFSYLKNHGTEVSPMMNSIILLCTVIPSAFAMLSATTLSRIFGYKNVVKVCGLVFSTVPFIINIKLTPATIGLCYLLVPVSCLSISSVPVLNCLWSQFPGHLNKVSGAAVLFFALGMVVFNLIFAVITNPYNEKASIDAQGQAFFSSQVSDNIFKSSNIIFAIAGSCYIIGSFLISKRQDEVTEQRNNSDELAEESPPADQMEDAPKSNEGITSSPTLVKKLKLRDTLTDKKFIILFCISFIVPLYLIYLTLFMKLIFMPIINDDHYLASCAIVMTVAAIIGAPFWGYVGDKKGFKLTLLFIIISDIVFKVLGLFCQQKWNIVLLYFMLSFNDKGILTIIGPGLIQMFGLEMATELIPYKGISLFLAYITVPAIQMLLSVMFTYRQILILFVIMTGVALFLAHYFYTTVEYEKHTQCEGNKQKKEKEFQQKNVDNYMP